MPQLIALVGFSFVTSVTPGPNNVLLWASGATFGLRRTLPHVVGTALGLGAMALGSAAGLAAVIAADPGLAVVMKVAGSVYLVYLAWQIARAGAPDGTSMARPFGVVRAASFQLVNPKAWVFALGAMTTFRPTDLPVVTGSLLVAVTMMLVIVPSATVWAAGGGAIGRLMTRDLARAVASGVLALLVVLTVILVWI
jgi:threonine/homoserine/homoserine lactone efflux protein